MKSNMLRENKLTSQLLTTLQQGGISKITRLRSTQGKNIELRREVGNNSFFADILISLSPKKRKEAGFFDTKKTKFIAIEVKISDWKQGLYQAWRYYSFAEKSYLALYKDYASNVNLDLFKEHNVGLIVFDENTIKVLHHPIATSFKKADLYEKELRENIWRRALAVESVHPTI